MSQDNITYTPVPTSSSPNTIVELSPIIPTAPQEPRNPGFAIREYTSPLKDNSTATSNKNINRLLNNQNNIIKLLEKNLQSSQNQLRKLKHIPDLVCTLTIVTAVLLLLCIAILIVVIVKCS